MPTKIVVSPRFPPAMLDIARSFVPAGFELVVVDAGTPEFAAALPDAAYYVGFPGPSSTASSSRPPRNSSWSS